MNRHVGQGAKRQGRRERKPVAGVAQPVTSDGRVDRKNEGLISGCGDPGHQVSGRSAVAPYIELEPLSSAGHRGRQILDRGRPHRGEGIGDVPVRGNGRDGGLARVVHEASKAGRSEAERLGARPAQRTRAGVQMADVTQDSRNELDVAKQLPGPSEAQLTIGRAVGVVEDGARSVPARDAAQVSDRLCVPRRRSTGSMTGRRSRSRGLSSWGRSSRRAFMHRRHFRLEMACHRGRSWRGSR